MKFPSEADAPELEIPGMFHRSLTDIITQVFENDVSQTFNMTPFNQFWTTLDHQTVKVFGEAYASPILMEAYEEINALPHDPGDDFERVVASIMVWSDATHLGSFGDASLWPFYVFLEISPSIHEAGLQLVHPIIWHTFLWYVSLNFKFNSYWCLTILLSASQQFTGNLC